MSEVDRLGLPPSARVLVMAGFASTYGFFHGIARGARLSSLRYLAENAHRLPRTRGTWYFFHKRKNNVVLRDGFNRGFITALKYGGVTALFFGLEAGLDRAMDSVSWFSTTGAAFGCGLLVSTSQHVSLRQTMRSVRNFTIFGAIAGLVQDRVRTQSNISRQLRQIAQAEQREAALKEHEKREAEGLKVLQSQQQQQQEMQTEARQH